MDTVSWQPLLREALAVLSLSADEQIRVNGPGCIACDLLNDFDHARVVAIKSEGQHPGFETNNAARHWKIMRKLNRRIPKSCATRGTCPSGAQTRNAGTVPIFVAGRQKNGTAAPAL
jgi:hypothetical protein